MDMNYEDAVRFVILRQRHAEVHDMDFCDCPTLWHVTYEAVSGDGGGYYGDFFITEDRKSPPTFTRLCDRLNNDRTAVLSLESVAVVNDWEPKKHSYNRYVYDLLSR